MTRRFGPGLAIIVLTNAVHASSSVDLYVDKSDGSGGVPLFCRYEVIVEMLKGATVGIVTVRSISLTRVVESPSFITSTGEAWTDISKVRSPGNPVLHRCSIFCTDSAGRKLPKQNPLIKAEELTS